MNALQARRRVVGALALAAFGARAQTATAPKKHRLVIQVTDNDPARWNMILNNTRNAQEDVGASDIDIEIVAYGPGIHMFKKDSAVGSRIDEAVKHGVKFAACQNTMRGMKLTPEDMLPSVGYVPAGVTELMKKQEEGWTYLRP